MGLIVKFFTPHLTGVGNQSGLIPMEWNTGFQPVSARRAVFLNHGFPPRTTGIPAGVTLTTNENTNT